MASTFWHFFPLAKAVARSCSIKNMLLKFWKIQRKTPVQEFWSWLSCRLEIYNFSNKETPAQVFFCEFRGSFKNSSFAEYLLTATPALLHPYHIYTIQLVWFFFDSLFVSSISCSLSKQTSFIAKLSGFPSA